MLTDTLNQRWTVLLVRGVIGIVFGVIAMAAPITAVLTLVLLFGLWALIDGIAALAHALMSGTVVERLLMALVGVVALVAAVVAITSPEMTAVALTWFLGIWLVVRGVVEGVTAVWQRGQGWPALIGLALLDLVLGIVLMANPGRAALGIAWFIGLLALVWGLVFVGLAVATWSATRRGTGRHRSGPSVPGVPAGGTP